MIRRLFALAEDNDTEGGGETPAGPTENDET